MYLCAHGRQVVTPTKISDIRSQSSPVAWSLRAVIPFSHHLTDAERTVHNLLHLCFRLTGPDTFEVDGNFTIRGVKKAEKLTLTVTGSGTIQGTMAFDRKQYGMNSGIPLMKIADRVEVTVNLKATRVSGPPVTLKQ